MVLLCKIERHRFKLAVSFEIRLEMLQQNNFFADGSWIVKECVLIYLLNGSSLVFFISNSINVNEMEQVRRCHNFGTVVEENSERA